MQLGMVGLGRMGADLVHRLKAPRAVWVMVSAGLTGAVISSVAGELEAGDVIIDGGNSYYRDDIDRAHELATSGIDHLDVGTSGGVFGRERGCCLMIGGSAPVVTRLDPIFAAIAPLRDGQYYRFDLDVGEISEVWRRGSVIASWLLDLTADALAEDPRLEGFTGRVSDSGEARWTVRTAIDLSVPADVLAAALFGRFSSREEADYPDRVLSAMRMQFGGHDERPAT